MSPWLWLQAGKPGLWARLPMLVPGPPIGPPQALVVFTTGPPYKRTKLLAKPWIRLYWNMSKYLVIMAGNIRIIPGVTLS